MTGATTHILRASLKARVYRDIEIEVKSPLYALAEAITNAFKFDFDRAFGFFSHLSQSYCADLAGVRVRGEVRRLGMGET